MPHRVALMKLFQENGVFAYIPLGYMAMIDTTALTQIITCLTGGVVAIFAVRYYIANTRKIEVDTEVSQLERDKLLMEKQVNTLTKKGGKKIKKVEDDD